ncbi:MAG: MFS transporter [Oscillospiraceae bacterium]
MTFLLAIVYLAFVSLGLPDALSGAAWPVMHKELDVPLSYIGIVSTIVIVCTIISSLMSDRITKRLGTGVVTALSVLISAVGLFGYSVSDSLAMLCIWAVPYGLGAGSIDAALNNYAAVHFAPRHMSWLHCFWGVGTIIGPYIMGSCLSNNGSWQGGYRIVSVIQAVLAVIMFFSLPLWKKNSTANSSQQKTSASSGIVNTLKIKGVPLALLAFFGYTALEATVGLWASSYLCECKGTVEDTAAKFAALFYLGITVGRLVSGFFANKLGDRKLIRIGFAVIIAGIALILLPVTGSETALLGLVITGIGCAPIYPSYIHSAPTAFGTQNSQSVIGLEMASACVGAAVIPPVFGILANSIGLWLYPIYILVFALLTILVSELLNRLLTVKREETDVECRY